MILSTGWGGGGGGGGANFLEGFSIPNNSSKNYTSYNNVNIELKSVGKKRPKKDFSFKQSF